MEPVPPMSLSSSPSKSPSKHFLSFLERLQPSDTSAATRRDSESLRRVASDPAPIRSLQSIIKDWSGRGSHVDFLFDEGPPLIEGRCLGRGSTCEVYETIVGGHVFAWKRRFCRNQVGAKEKKEIEILKKLSHHHMVRLAGSYTHRQFLGLLLHPVAICDLHTFFEDFETVCTGKEPKANQQDRLRALRLPYGSPSSCHEAGKRYIFSKIGCITSAIEYLHSQKIQHKDLKPANIVITRDGLWLTDFGSATDFSELTHSNTEGDGHGTERYLAPEIVDYEPSGIAADVFSLGCVLLEICAIACKGTLEPFRFPRTAQHRSGSFQANLHRLEEWFAIFENFDSAKIRHVLCEIRQMLAKDPKRRPKAMASHRTFSSVDHMEPIPDFYLFGSCCENPFMARREHRRELKKLKEDFAKESERKYRSHYKETQKLQKQVFLAEANMSRLGPVNDVTELELREAFYTNC